MPARNISLSVNMAMTLDGKVSRPDGRWHGLTSAEDRHRMDLYRLEAEALIVGKNSVIQDNPVISPKQALTGKEKWPLPVMICRNSLPPVESNFFQQQTRKPLLLINRRLAPNLSAYRACSDIELLHDLELQPPNILARLEQAGIRRVLLEGGPALNHAFFREDLVDVLYLTITPYLIGQRNLLNILDGEKALPDYGEKRWDLQSAETIENEVFLMYKRRR